ncbi:MAG: hypothetical protein JWL73_588 [Actinomycetia bacterium]|nr:hypothetical protein [Actinomycetes bacterium]
MTTPIRSRADATDPPVVRIPRPSRLRRRPSSGHLVMIAAGLLGAVLTLVAFAAADHRVDIAVAAHDLHPGEVVDRASFRFERVQMGSQLLDRMVSPEAARSLRGSITRDALTAGDPVPRSSLLHAAARRGRRSLSIAVPKARAVGGNLTAGDRIDVFDQTGIIATDVEVLDVRQPGGSAGLTGDDAVSIIVAVDATQAAQLAREAKDDSLVVVLATGAAPLPVAPLPVTSTTAPAP